MFSIGIDLGTTNSVASYMDGTKPVVALNGDDASLTPSVVSYEPLPGGAGHFLVGRSAVNYSVQAPRNTVYSVKRLMGLHFGDDNVQELVRRVPYRICEQLDGGDVGVKVEINGKMYSPIEVSTMILRRIKEDSSRRLLRPVDAATITVPAYFLDSQRNATKEAGEAADLRLHPLLDEPIAAALSFGYDHGDKERLLVYDLGGGTFDVSLIQMAGDNLQVISKRGNMWLGGDDFDQAIIARMLEWLSTQYHVDSVDDPSTKRLLKHHAELAKKALSDKPSTTILEQALLTLPDGQKLPFELTITRDEFNAAIGPLVEKSLELVDEVLKEAAVSPRQLTGVLLVGGSTNVPLVRKRLADRFGAAKLRHDVDPMTCVSLGAAVWCRRFPFESNGKISRINYARTGMPIPMDLGVEVYCDGDCHHFEPIIRRNTVYPTTPGAYTKEFFPTVDNQNAVRIPIFQGNAKSTTLNSYQGLIYQKLPRSLPARTPIVLSFEIDEHGNLSGEIDFKGFPELRGAWKIDRTQSLIPDDEQAQLRNWRPAAEQILSIAADFKDKYKQHMSEQEMQTLDALVSRLRASLAGNDRVQCGADVQELQLAVFGKSTACVLFRSARAVQIAGKTGVGREIALGRKELEDALRDGKVVEITLIRSKLADAVDEVFRVNTVTAGPLPDQVTPSTR